VTPDWLKDPVGSALRGENPTVMARMKSGFAVFGIVQYWPGYCLLLACPEAARLEDIDRTRRATFLDEMGVLGEAVARVCSPRRVNYSIYGNTAPYVHAHVVPRYDWESEERILAPIWNYPRDIWENPEHAFDEKKHGALKARIASALVELSKA
jgi:diadenosine tetraphosphate (Ap4A) HIT family hydrolase